jgi:signal transduction histidine kinase
VWIEIVAKIREAINSGDSGPLIMSSAIYSIVYTVQNVVTFLAVFSLTLSFNRYKKISFLINSGVTLISFALINHTINTWQLIPWESFSSIISAITVLLLIKNSFHLNNNFYRTIVIATMVFFAFQWLNMMPLFSNGQFGTTDIPVSIKITSQYLQSDAVLNFVGLAFFIPLFLSALITSTLFVSFDKNIAIAHENHAKEIALETIRATALEQRVYLEINSIAHDLKTPLVTIRGLNSLLMLSPDQEKTMVYSEKIDSAVEKMSDMISAFLYETSKQRMSVSDLVDYMRAQIPIDDDFLRVITQIEPDLPEIYINKIRVSRAMINIVENAIRVPSLYPIKEIDINAKREADYVCIEIIDNGTGISSEKLKEIWNMGYSDYNSTGLGLFFVKKIIEENGGTVTIQSVVGTGTTVQMRFPTFER